MTSNPLSLSPSADSADHQTRLQRIILNFTPSWFSVNMGTGIISILLHTTPHSFPGLDYIAIVFYLLNITLFVLFISLTIARYVLYPWVFMRMLQHSTQSLFIGTLPMGLATIINATVLIAVPAYGTWARDFAWTLWWIDVVLSVMSCFGVPALMFYNHAHTLDKMTAAWLLPIVPTVVAAASGGLVATVLEPNNAIITLAVSYVLWGVGMSVSFLVMAMYLHRLMIHKLPTHEVIVSAFLPLGPVGQGAFGIIEMSQAGKVAYPATSFLGVSNAADVIFVMSVLVALLLWGFGLWWLFHGIVSVLIRHYDGGLKHNMGYWGFIFPLGVYTAATIALGNSLTSTFFSYLSVVFILALVMLYGFVATGSIHGAYTGTLLVAPCLSDLRATMPRTLNTVENEKERCSNQPLELGETSTIKENGILAR